MDGLATFHWAFRRRVRDRDIFFFGTAMVKTSSVQSSDSRKSLRTAKGER
ncbi:hypothetical protein MNBD_ACTINO01-1274, partial [hydrothermal vent metagenome]